MYTFVLPRENERAGKLIKQPLVSPMGPVPYKKGKQLGPWKAGGERRSQEWSETVRSLLDETLCPISTKDLSIRLALPAPAPPPRSVWTRARATRINSAGCVGKKEWKALHLFRLRGFCKPLKFWSCSGGAKHLGITYFCAHKGSRENMTFTRSMFGKKTSRNSWTLKALYK